MASIPEHRSLSGTTERAGVDPVIVAFIENLRVCEGVAGKHVSRYRVVARHFLTWLERSGIALETVDCTVIERFLRHDCECCAGARSSTRLHPWRKRRTSPPLMMFVRFLERTGKIETPGELDDNLEPLDAFVERLRGDGYTSRTIALYRRECTGLIAWLHFARIRLRDLSPDVYARFRKRQFICSIPGVFYGQRMRSPRGTDESGIRRFFAYLVSIGRIEPLEPAPEEEALSGLLERFSVWLERHRGVHLRTIRQHIRLIATVLPGLGDDPGAYDAALLRRVLSEQIEHCSVSYAKKLTTAMRMYLRFLASEGVASAALVEALPRVPQRRLSGLPRYIAADDVERTIASCGDDPMGVRDRAILLLLARLALRAGDIVDLRLGDIDWDKAEIRVSGKSRRRTALPLPQDAGDALRVYIETVRPGEEEEKVFLCANAPRRPFTCSSSVGTVAQSALNRAGVTTFAGRGANVFRHSRATELLRSGASLDVIRSLLRHASPKTTVIYAKTDTLMLREVAQPWIGGTEG